MEHTTKLIRFLQDKYADELKVQCWVKIHGAKYTLFEDGKVWSRKHNKFLSSYKTPQGYLLLDLYNEEGKRTRQSVHRLVAKWFLNKPVGTTQVNHINGNKEDNRKQNLEWVTSSQNNKHSYEFLGRKNGMQTSTEKTRKAIIELEKMVVSGQFGGLVLGVKRTPDYQTYHSHIYWYDKDNNLESFCHHAPVSLWRGHRGRGVCKVCLRILHSQHGCSLEALRRTNRRGCGEASGIVK